MEKALKYPYGWTPLNAASANGHIEVVRLLLENRADITVVDKKGGMPLLTASWYGHVKVVKLLLENGADITAVDRDGVCSAAVDVTLLDNTSTMNMNQLRMEPVLVFAVFYLCYTDCAPEAIQCPTYQNPHIAAINHNAVACDTSWCNSNMNDRETGESSRPTGGA